MALTVNNIGTLSLLNILNRTASQQETVLERMATGSRINRGADDPAGLVAIALLESELTSVSAGITSNQRTDAMLGVADNALAEVSNLVNDIQRLADESANDAALTADEVAANQAQIDDALASIDRIVGNTNFNGAKLLDGSLGINATIQAAVGTDLTVYSRAPGEDAVITIDREGKKQPIATKRPTRSLPTCRARARPVGSRTPPEDRPRQLPQ